VRSSLFRSLLLLFSCADFFLPLACVDFCSAMIPFRQACICLSPKCHACPRKRISPVLRMSLFPRANHLLVYNDISFSSFSTYGLFLRDLIFCYNASISLPFSFLSVFFPSFFLMFVLPVLYFCCPHFLADLSFQKNHPNPEIPELETFLFDPFFVCRPILLLIRLFLALLFFLSRPKVSCSVLVFPKDMASL